MKKKITFLKMMLLAVVMMAGSVALKAQGSETFETQAVITAAYADGTFSSETAGVTVNFGHSRTTKVSDTEDYSISGKGLMLRRASDSYLEFVIPTGGVGKFSFQYSKAFTGSSPRQLELLVNGVQVGTTDEYGGATGADATVYDFSNDVNTPGAVTIRIKNVGATTGNRQTSIDNVTWTGYAGTPTPSIAANPATLDFSNVNVGETSTAQTVTVTGANLTTAPTYTVDNSAFAVTGTLTATGGTLSVTYTPTAAGASEGVLTISGDDKTATVNLSGTGVIAPLDAPIAVSATSVSQSGFTANWGAVTGATGYEINVYTKEVGGDSEVLSQEFTWTENGTGGNDDLWSGSIAGSTKDIATDIPGWTFTSAYKGNNCIKMGAGSTQGVLTTPALGISGNATLTFRAAAWNGTNEQTELLLEISGGGTLDQTSVAMVKGAFTDYTVAITGATAETKITFKGKQASNSRFFLDDVLVSGSAVAITHISGSPFTSATTSQTVSGLNNSLSYYYSVIAVRGEEKSPVSNEIGPISILTGLADVRVDALAWTSSGKVMLNASAGEVIEIFNVAGQKVLSRMADDGLNTVNVPVKGVVIVKAGNRVSKVIL